MAKSWAIVVGVDKYEHLQEKEHLKFAVRDAEQMRTFLCEQAEFQQDYVILCSDKSEPVGGLNTRPNRSNLRRILLKLGETPEAKGAEHAWFFFSGHGLLGEDNQDYLLTVDAYPGDLKDTAVSINFVIQQLTKCDAKNTVLVLDMCRNETVRSRKGSEAEVAERTIQLAQQIAQQNGIITIFSCSRGGCSYEVPELKQGAFTHAFLEGLNKYTSLRQLDEYLCHKVFELTESRQPRQLPIIAVEPAWRCDLPLLKSRESHADTIENLMEQATIALYKDKDLPLAKQLWERVNDGAVNPQDKKRSREALIEIDRIIRGGFANIDSQLTQSKDKISKVRSTTDKTNPFKSETIGIFSWEDSLNSDEEVDYSRLRDLLTEKRWKEADEETKNVLLKAAKKDKQGYLTDSDIQNLSCKDLNTIDHLWVKYSKDWFGFSVQKEIYLKCGGQMDNESNVRESFSDAVGWRKSGDWHWYDNLNFSISAPRGHLPAYLWRTCLYGIFSRMDSCKSSDKTIVGTEG